MEARTLSRDAASAVKNYCYSNLREFYSRHVEQFDISYQTFLRVVNGGKVTEETYLRVVSALRELNLVDSDDTPSHFDAVYTMLYSFVKKAEQVVANPNHENLKTLRDQVVDVRQFLRSYVTL